MNEQTIREKYLPVGTVVLLKNGSKRIMINGFCTMDANQPEKVFDYSGVLFPEGSLSSDQTLLFDHNQIIRVDHMGLEDAEEKEFKVKLVELINSQNVSSEENNNFVADNAPVQPVTPAEPVAPVFPAEPAAPVAPVAPVFPAEPGTPVAPVAPVFPAEPTAPVQPTAPVAPVTPVAPMNINQQPIQTDAANPVNPTNFQ